MEIEIVNKYKNGLSIESLCKEYTLGKLKIKKILQDNNVEIRKKGGQTKHKNNLNNLTNYEGLKLSCKNCQKEFNDILNKSGAISDHIKTCYTDVEIPSSFKRRMYLKDTGQHWHHQYFNLVEKTENPIIKCLDCEWTTNDLSNKTGALTKHIEKTHGNISDYLNKHSNQIHLFTTYKNKVERDVLFNNDDNFITCLICGEQFKTISNTHLSLHNTTTIDYKLKYGENSLISKTTKNEFIENLKNIEPNFNYRSKSEIEIEVFLKSMNVDVIVCDKKQLNGIELDLFLPKHNIAIEYNGLYWHSEKRGKTKNYHIDKTNRCLEKNIQLIHIFSDEWLSKKDIIKNRLKNLIKLNETKIFARKCSVVELTKEEKSSFLNKNHLQGNDKSSTCLGLKYGGTIVAVMTFGGLRKVLGSTNIEPNTYELFRFCSLNVVGGFSKLLNYFIKNYNPKKIITYSNRNWSPSDEYSFYSKVGFKFIGITKPNYSYTKKYDVREHRFNFRKDKLVKMGYDKNKSETQIMLELGYDKIWDTGNLKYEFILK